jgi:hypothetical protein
MQLNFFCLCTYVIDTSITLKTFLVAQDWKGQFIELMSSDATNQFTKLFLVIHQNNIRLGTGRMKLNENGGENLPRCYDSNSIYPF